MATYPPQRALTGSTDLVHGMAGYGWVVTEAKSWRLGASVGQQAKASVVGEHATEAFALNKLADELHELYQESSGDAKDAWRTCENMIRALLRELLPKPAVRTCSWCDITDEQNFQDGYGNLTDVRVITAASEEGFADIERFMCNGHLITVTALLRGMGFKDHRHGGINFLEDDHCPGFDHMEACPTPAKDDDDDRYHR